MNYNYLKIFTTICFLYFLIFKLKIFEDNILEKKQKKIALKYKDEYNGVIDMKKTGNKGIYLLKFKNENEFYNLGLNGELYSLIDKGDSLVKKQKSFEIIIYKSNNKIVNYRYQFNNYKGDFNFLDDLP